MAGNIVLSLDSGVGNTLKVGYDPWCYIPGERTRQRPTYPNTSTEAVEPD